LELGVARVAELEKANAEKVAKIAQVKRALEEAKCKRASLEGEVAS